MANIEANLNDIEAWGGEITKLPPGEFSFKIKAADIENKEKDGKTQSQLVVDLEVISGPFAGKTAKSWFGLDFTKDTPRKRLKSLVNASGIAVSPNGSFDSAQLIGCKINADVTHETYMTKAGLDVVGGSVIPPEEKIAVRVVNERPFREVAGTATANGTSAPTPISGGASLPGLTKT